MKPNIQCKINFSVNGKEETIDVKKYAYTIYNKDGRSVYTYTFDGTECWWEYNKAGIMVHNVQKSPNGKALEEIKKFDEDGKILYHRNDFEGPIENLYNYSEDGKLQSITYKNGGGRFFEYNDDGKLVYECKKSSKGIITWEEHYQYDEINNDIHKEVKHVDLDLEVEEDDYQEEETNNMKFSDDERYLIFYEDGIVEEIQERIENEDDTVTIVSYRF